jgi:tRNA (cmo5U34)-methyltransferase
VTVRRVRREETPAAPFVAAHFSFPQEEGEQALWLSRHAAFVSA